MQKISEVPEVSENPPPVQIPEELQKMPQLQDFDVGDSGPGGPVLIGKGGDIVAPTAITKILPTYPENMRRLGREADVKVAFTVHKDGSVSDVKVVSGPAEFGEAVMTSIKRTMFTPATRQGRPLAVRLSIKFKFRLTGVAVQQETDSE